MTAPIAAPHSPLIRFATVGLAAWVIATGAIRMAPLGGLQLRPVEAAVAILFGLCAVVGLAVLLMRDVAPNERIAAMSAFVLPGMVGDSLTTAFFGKVFPNLPKGSGGVFGAIMLAGYAIMLTVAIVRSAGPRPA